MLSCDKIPVILLKKIRSETTTRAEVIMNWQSSFRDFSTTKYSNIISLFFKIEFFLLMYNFIILVSGGKIFQKNAHKRYIRATFQQQLFAKFILNSFFSLTLSVHILDEEKKLSWNFYFTLLCGALKGFEVPQRSMKIKNLT